MVLNKHGMYELIHELPKDFKALPHGIFAAGG